MQMMYHFTQDSGAVWYPQIPRDNSLRQLLACSLLSIVTDYTAVGSEPVHFPSAGDTKGNRAKHAI